MGDFFHLCFNKRKFGSLTARHATFQPGETAFDHCLLKPYAELQPF